MFKYILNKLRKTVQQTLAVIELPFTILTCVTTWRYSSIRWHFVNSLAYYSFDYTHHKSSNLNRQPPRLVRDCKFRRKF